MGDLSAAILVGRLTRDAELKYTATGQAICHFSVATNSRVKKGDQWVDEPNYWEIDLWGKTAENLNQYLTKGTMVAVNGDMRQDKWEQDGQTRMKVKIKAYDVRLLGGNNGQRPSVSTGGGQSYDRPAPRYGNSTQGMSNSNPQSQSPAPQSRIFPSQAGSPANDDFPDDIPF